ncbi:MAG: dihydroorotate dehydrogenase electron transfer subunit [Clostridia bacterium]
MTNKYLYKVIANEPINNNVYKLTISGDTSKIKYAGQFCDIKIDRLFLRRPISIYDYTKDTITMVYKVVGEGTDILSKVGIGETLDVLVGLGNGFDINKCGSEIEIVGGGIGVPPLYYLAKQLISIGKKPKILLGFNTKDDVILVEDFEKLGLETQVYTVDGSFGKKGFVTNGQSKNAYVFTCGPLPMLQAVYNNCSKGQFSFEARMGCGFGACMGCTTNTKNGPKRICKDGPILYWEEIIW